MLLHDQEGRHLVLTPFLTFADQVPVRGVLDVFILNKVEKQQGETVEIEQSEKPLLQEVPSTLSTAEVFQTKYRQSLPLALRPSPRSVWAWTAPLVAHAVRETSDHHTPRCGE